MDSIADLKTLFSNKKFKFLDICFLFVMLKQIIL